MSIDTTLQLLKLFMGHQYGVTKKQIAERLGKDTRTVERYLKQLREAGLPLEADGGPKDGVALRWKLDRSYFSALGEHGLLLELTDREMFLTVAAIESADLPECDWLDEARQNVLRKIGLSLKPRHQNQLPVLRAGIAAPQPRQGKPEDIASEAFSNLLDAMLRRRRTRVEYPWKGEEPSRRLFSPLGFVLGHASIYCLGRVGRYRNNVYLKMERIRGVEVLNDEEIRGADGFDLHRELGDNFGFWLEKPEKVRIRFDPAVADAIRTRRIHPSQQVEEEPDGGLILQLHVAGRWELIRWLLGWGNDAELLEPPSWRKEIARIARTTAERYAGKS